MDIEPSQINEAEQDKAGTTDQQSRWSRELNTRGRTRKASHRIARNERSALGGHWATVGSCGVDGSEAYTYLLEKSNRILDVGIIEECNTHEAEQTLHDRAAYSGQSSCILITERSRLRSSHVVNLCARRPARRYPVSSLTKHVSSMYTQQGLLYVYVM